MANNAVLFLVVGLLVGVAAGAAVGYFMWNSSDDDETTYWYYIDYADYATSTVKNGWISAESDTVVHGLFKALDANKIEYAISESGWITSINGVEPTWDATSSESWGSWIWTVDKYTPQTAWEKCNGLDVTIGNTFYIVVTSYNPTTYEMLDGQDPDSKSAWKNGGPFA